MKSQYSITMPIIVPYRVAARLERGISLMVVLVALVLMSLAAVGLIRMVDTGTLVIGNLAFKQSTTAAADIGVQGGVNWLQSRLAGTTLYQNNTSAGYYASSLEELDITGKSSRASRVLVDWNNDNCAYATSGTYASCVAPTTKDDDNGDGYLTSYVIMRMCKTAGDPNATGNNCAKPVSNNSAQSPKKGELKYGEDKRFTTSSGPYFRIVVRSEGPRNTVSFTETYVHF